MKKIRSGLAAAFTAAVIMMHIISGGIVASAAETTAKITAPQSVETGERFTVTVTFTSSVNIGSAKARLDYDSDLIEFVSGDFASGAGGVCLINGWSETMGKTDSYELTFKAVGEGTVDMSLSRVSVYSDGGDLIGSPSGSASMKVKAKSVSQTAVTTTTTEPEQTSPVTTTTTAEEQTTTEQTTTTESAPVVTTTTTETTSQSVSSENTPSQTDADTAPGGEITTPEVTDLPDDSSSAEESGSSSKTETESEAENSDTKSAVTAILLIVGCIAIACILMTGDGSNKKKRSRKR